MTKDIKKGKTIKVIKTKNVKKQGQKKFSNKIIFIGIVILIILLSMGIFIYAILNKKLINKEIITINDISYSKSDYMMYLYSAKYSYFGENYDQEYDMDMIIDTENDVSLKDYLQNQVLTQLKTATLIENFAYRNNIELGDKDYKSIENDKKDFIKKLGGIGKFKTFLKKNNTTEDSYDKLAENNALYNKIIKKLFSEGKIYDLTDKEKSLAKVSYKDNYYKIEQIVFTTIDLQTGKSLSETTINQKLLLAKTILEEANKKETNFIDLIKKYSEDTSFKEDNYDQYFRKEELLDEIKNELSTLDSNKISDIIQTKYAIHIIKKLELDDGKLNDYYDTLREEKFVENLVEDMKNIKIIYHDDYKKINIK